MKRFLTAVLIVLMIVFGLSGCGCDDGKNVDLVFLNETDAPITSVSIEMEGRSEGVRHADCSPLRPGESYGFEVEGYPVTVVAYEEPTEQKELARVTVSEPPSNGERWYVTARDEVGGLTLAVDTR